MNNTQMNQINKLTLIPGNWSIPHNGHMKMIEHYANNQDKVLILIQDDTRNSSYRTLPNGKHIQAQTIKNIFKNIILPKYGLSNKVEVNIAWHSQPIRAMLDLLSSFNKLRASKKPLDVTLGVSDKGNDISRYRGWRELNEQWKNIHINDPEKTIYHLKDNLSSSILRKNIDNKKYIMNNLPWKLDDEDKEKIYNMILDNDALTSVSENAQQMSNVEMALYKIKSIIPNIKYGYYDKKNKKIVLDDKNLQNYKIQSPEITEQYKVGVCYDTAQIINKIFKDFKVQSKSLFLFQPPNGLSHMTIIYKDNNLWKWCDGSLDGYTIGKDNGCLQQVSGKTVEEIAQKIAHIFKEMYGNRPTICYLAKGKPKVNSCIQDIVIQMIRNPKNEKITNE